MFEEMKQKMSEGLEGAKVLGKEQAANIWGSVMEKVVEGKESAAEKVTLLKGATVEKVNSMKESVDDAIALQSDSPALEATWFGLGSSGKGQLDESQVNVALTFFTILGALIFIFLGLLIYTFINGGLPGGKKIKEDAKDTSG